MKTLRKILSYILTITLTVLITMLLMVCTIKSTIIDGILYENFKSMVFQKQYNEANTLDDIITEDGVITNNEFVNEILDSKEIRDLVNSYLDKMITAMASDDTSLDELDEINIEQDMVNYLKENKSILSEKTGVEITDEMIDSASEKMNWVDTKKIINQTISNAKNNMSEEEKLILKVYQFLTSEKLKTIIFIGILVNTLLIAIVQMSLYKWIKNLSISMILGGVGVFGVSIITKKLIETVLPYANIETTSMRNISIATLVLGIVINIIYLIITKLLKKGDKHEISKVSN